MKVFALCHLVTHFVGTQSANPNRILDASKNKNGINLKAVEGKCGDAMYRFVESNATLMIFGSGSMADGNEYWSRFIKDIESICIIEHVTTVGAKSFSFLPSLTFVSIGGDVESIGVGAFLLCNLLETVEITSPLIDISDGAFSSCDSLSGIVIPDSVERIGVHSFASCTKLRNIVIGNKVKYIYDHAFELCTLLTDVTIPNSVLEIGYKAFYGCSIKNLILGDSLQVIGDSSFSRNNLTRVTISAIDIGCCSFESNTALESVSLGNSVKSIGRGAFAFTNISEFDFPDSVQIIEGNPFYGCTRLTSFNTLTNEYFYSEGRILYNALKTRIISYPTAEGLYEIISNVFRVENYSFANTIVDSIIIHNAMTIGDNAFYHCCELNSIDLGSHVQTIGIGAFSETKIQSLVIPKSTFMIGSRSFQQCASLEHVILGDNVESIGSRAFQSCTALESIVIPNLVSVISCSLFDSCTSLKSVVLSKSIIIIEPKAFYSCSSLESVTIPQLTQEIQLEAFSCCTSLRNVTLGKALNNVSKTIFTKCQNITNVQFKGNHDICVSGLFNDSIQILPIVVPRMYADNEFCGISIVRCFSNFFTSQGKHSLRVLMLSFYHVYMDE